MDVSLSDDARSLAGIIWNKPSLTAAPRTSFAWRMVSVSGQLLIACLVIPNAEASFALEPNSWMASDFFMAIVKHV
jgi:hypothetical protein